MNLKIVLLCLAAVILQSTASGAAPQPRTRPAESPIRVWDETRDNPPLHLHFVSIDLRDPSIKVRVVRSGEDPDGPGPWETTLATVKDVADRESFDVAVNGNLFETKDSLYFFGRKNPFFAGNWAKVMGWAMSDGRLWSSAAPDASLIVDTSGHVRIGKLDKVPDDAQQIVSGSQLLVSKGRNIASGDDLAPRTSAGVDQGGQTLTLLVIDGRRPAYSAGVTLPQLADEMIRAGCSDALNLDGGGSSTLAVRDPQTGQIRIANYPSDGHDLLIPLSIARPVADVLGIRIRTRPTTAPATRR